MRPSAPYRRAVRASSHVRAVHAFTVYASRAPGDENAASPAIDGWIVSASSAFAVAHAVSTSRASGAIRAAASELRTAASAPS